MEAAAARRRRPKAAAFAARSIGYVAPEYGTTGSVSAAGDAYSFGITLLEILVGKAPTDSGFGEGQTLPEFVTAAFPERIEQVLDPSLLVELDVARDCLTSAVRAGLSCCRRAPYERMSMKEAAAEMHLIRDACVRACGANKPAVLSC